MLWLPIDRTLPESLIRQIYEQVRRRILHGEIRAGTLLPSSRELAAELHVSRNVVLEAYDQLIAEGYIESHAGSGTYVAEGASLPSAMRPAPPALSKKRAMISYDSDLIDFRSGLPALDLFPRQLWGRLTQQVYAEATPALLGYDNPAGREELRIALAGYLWRSRGIDCSYDRIIITSGAAQACSLLAKLLLTERRGVIMEDPSPREIQTIFTSAGATLSLHPTDLSGLRTNHLSVDAQTAFIFVTPSHQFPLGAILSIQRRIQLIQLVQAADCYIVEDDYDSEFRYIGTPVSSLYELDSEHVIYIGSFSKTLSPALRLGYIILPSSLVDGFCGLKRLHDLHCPSLEQVVLARFIEEGLLERHLMKMKRVYRRRRAALLASLQRHFADEVSLLGDATGLHLVAAFTGTFSRIDFSSPALLAELERCGVRVYPVAQHARRKEEHRQQIIMGYAHLESAQIEQGVARLRDALRTLGSHG